MNKRLFALVFSFLGLVLLSCSACAPVGPDYQPPQTRAQKGWEAMDNVPVAEHSPTQWWQLFHDAGLTSLIDAAVANNCDLRIAVANIRAARSQRSMDNASVSSAASSAGTRTRRSDSTTSSGRTYNLFEIGFDASWEIDMFGGRRRLDEADAALLAAAEEDYRDVLVSLQAEVARNYFELRGTQNRLVVARETISAGEKTVELIEGRYREGIGSELDLVEAKTELGLSRAKIPPLQAAIRQNIQHLRLLTGQPATVQLDRLAKFAELPEIPASMDFALPSEVLQQRPDIRAAERRLAAATADIGVATADLYPHFSLSALGGLQSIDLADLLTAGSRFWTIGPHLNLPLFNQGQIRAGVVKKEAERDRALAVYEKTVLTAFAEVETALVDFRQEQEKERILAETVTSGAKSVTIADGLFAIGLTDFLHILQSRRSLYQSQDQLIQSRQQLVIDIVTIYKALGGGWQNMASSAPAMDKPKQEQISSRKNTKNE
jgi:multidrug efflux system outer membrane protein